MTLRSFDCPNTGNPCTNIGCTVLYCETQAARNLQPRPYRLSSMDTATGWVMNPGNTHRLEGVSSGSIFEGRRRDNTSGIRARVGDYEWEHRQPESSYRGQDIMAYRILVSGTSSCPIPSSYTPWNGGRECPLPRGARCTILFRGTHGSGLHNNTNVWAWEKSWSNSGASDDIIGYKDIVVVEPALPEGWTATATGASGEPPILPLGTRVDVQDRSGRLYTDRAVSDLSWPISGGSRDITAYWVIPQETAPLPEGFIRWDGAANRPDGLHSGDVVTVILRREAATMTFVTEAQAVRSWRWSHENDDWDIIAYRLDLLVALSPITPQPTPAMNIGPLLEAEMPGDLAMSVTGALSGAESVAFRSWLTVHRTAYAAAETTE